MQIEHVRSPRRRSWPLVLFGGFSWNQRERERESYSKVYEISKQLLTIPGTSTVTGERMPYSGNVRLLVREW